MTTRLYFHLASSAVEDTLPTAAQSTLTADVNGDAQTVNRKMNTTVGAAQGEVDITTNATASRQNLYFTKFVSEPIYQSSVAANTWTYGFCAWTIVRRRTIRLTARIKPFIFTSMSGVDQMVHNVAAPS